ncbi:hypothetical protein [Streptomyces sp. CL12-4]|uniref:hypothetical protein n=1 Tax=Streptomyces sp. CL12-4 TaxID=2810306 RepID=UPI001EFB2470|nr:hypothetical protein [Streptomyces sp. CL12-4]MCG8971787.1 hypothetical protein [Streptomyces sp. CL12-4]
MSEHATGHPVTIEIRTPRPMPVTALATLTEVAQGLADRLGAGPLITGKHFRQDGDDFVFSFVGHAMPEDDPAEEFVHTAARKEPFRIR